MADISEEDLQKEIAAILEDADLSKTSVKKVRQELEKKLDCKLLSRKTEIDNMVMEFIEKKKKNDDDEDEEEEEEEEEEDEEDSESDKKKKRGSTGKKPPAKKAKKRQDSEDEDSDASEPSKDGDSEEEYSPKKSGKGKPFKTRKLPPKKKKGSESDSDEDWDKGKKAKKGGGAKRGGGGYTKPMTLSKELAALVGEETMARHEVVKKVWEIIKERDLYDPKNKQFAICDDALFKVIGVKRFRTFGMMKYLKNHFSS